MLVTDLGEAPCKGKRNKEKNNGRIFNNRCAYVVFNIQRIEVLRCVFEELQKVSFSGYEFVY